MILNYVIILACVLTVRCKNLPGNTTAIISKYAKVAHWGAVSPTTTEKSQSEGRSHNGQTRWTHRSDVNTVRGQNVKTVKPSVVYHYAVQKVGHGKTEILPGVGEVQERFNPRPYFDYIHQSSQYSNSNSKTNNPSPTSPPTFDSFPVFSKPPEPSNPPIDLYTSQYSSYNPPISGAVAPSADKPDIEYPPNAPPPPGDTDDGPPSDSNGYLYNPPQPDSSPAPQGPPKPSYPSLGPPLAPHHHDHKEQIYYPPSDDDHHETILDHPPPGWQEDKPDDMAESPDMGGPPDMGGASGMGKPPAMMGSAGMGGAPGMMGSAGMGGPPGMMGSTDMGGPPDMGGSADMAAPDMNGHDMAEHDLSPPPSPDFNGRFPPYLYGDHANGHDFSSYDFDHHHVYKEITTTTTTEAPEDERVNKGHYSYYYLGRKLWYIPLYFSVYFIIYVTILILKSIARHKIQFKQDHLKFRNNQGRQLNLDDVHENVTAAIETSRRKFAYVAM